MQKQIDQILGKLFTLARSPAWQRRFEPSVRANAQQFSGLLT